MLPDWEGAGMGRLLPAWAEELSRTCRTHTFSTMQVSDGRAVVAVQAGDGSGPLLVVTRHEDEMRAALGLKAREPHPS
jgi:hypothetical protein